MAGAAAVGAGDRPSGPASGAAAAEPAKGGVCQGRRCAAGPFVQHGGRRFQRALAPPAGGRSEAAVRGGGPEPRAD
eukprot:11181516-Lingulodinium_polyedra.AAC.1